MPVATVKKMAGSYTVLQFSRTFLIVVVLQCLHGCVIGTANFSTLQLVQIVARHGSRAPILPFPTDIYKNASIYTPNGWGELTETGAKQVYQLGLYLRQRYDGFLPRKYLKKDFLMLSSDIDRAIMSAEANLAGLYGLGPGPRSRDLFKEWQPVPIHTIPEGDDNLIEGKAPCPKYVEELMNHFKTEEFQTFITENQDFFNFIFDMSGKPRTSEIEQIFQVQDVLRCQCAHNLTLPTWANNTVYDRLQYLKALSFMYKVGNEQMKRLKVGPMLNKLVGGMRAKVEASSLILDENNIPPYTDLKAFRKVIVFSGHDSTIAGILHTLNLFQPHIPPFASALLIELHKRVETGEFFVELYYRNDTTKEATQLDLTAICGSPCPFDEFANFANKFIPADWKLECQTTGDFPMVYSSWLHQKSVLMSSTGGNEEYDSSDEMQMILKHPLGLSAPGLPGFVMGVIGATGLLAAAILLSSFLRERMRISQIPMDSYHHLS